MNIKSEIISIVGVSLLSIFITIVSVYAFHKYVEEVVSDKSTNPELYENVINELRSLENEFKFMNRKIAFEIEHRQDLVRFNKMCLEKLEGELLLQK